MYSFMNYTKSQGGKSKFLAQKFEQVMNKQKESNDKKK